MTAFLAIVVVGVGTYLSRAIFILALADRTIPPRVASALQYVGPAVLSALVVALMIDGDGQVAAGVAEIGGLSAAGLVAWKTRNLIYTLALGMAVFWLLQIWF